MMTEPWSAATTVVVHGVFKAAKLNGWTARPCGGRPTRAGALSGATAASPRSRPKPPQKKPQARTMMNRLLTTQ